MAKTNVQPKDITGEKFNHLTAVRLVSITKDKNNKTIYKWLFQCDCGKEVICDKRLAIYGRKKSCGCARGQAQVKDLTGQRFGRLTVLKQAERIHMKGPKWLCQCDCGNITKVFGKDLRSGNTQSCGCLHKEFCYNLHFRDLSGQRFGKLVCLEHIGYDKFSHAIWKCKCDCGNIAETSSPNLINGHTMSCGCLKSHGEAQIKSILQQNNIRFVSQKMFEDCRFPDTGKKARFDFYINNSYVIEYDGILHFETKNSGWNNDNEFARTKERDAFKNQYCKDHNIPLIRIPYTKLDNITLDDLILETSSFRVS